MLVPVKWLREFVEFEVPVSDLAEALTMAGLEVDGIINRFSGFEEVVIAKVLKVEPHPQADRLRLAEVDFGRGVETIVCGAPNLHEGMLSVLALPGAVLGEDMQVKKTKIRGVESVGMLCSERELGLSDDHSGIMDLKQDLNPGQPLTEAFNLETQVLEIAITPNRGDALSVLGVARDVAAIYGLPLKRPEIGFQEYEPPISQDVEITVTHPEGCPRYTARLVRGVKIAPSPVWMADRLSACGLRPISNVVDITNYILMERGQPLHAFDFSRLAGSKVDVRWARPKEPFTTLDGQDRVLKEDMLLICDAEKPVGLAGVMGGLNSEIGDDTEDVLIESAYFDPLCIRRTSKNLGLVSEASYRFERGIDLAGCATSADRAAQLTAQLAGGKVAKGILDVYKRPYEAPRLPLSLKWTNRFLGMPLQKEQVVGPLKNLGLTVEETGDGDGLTVIIPAHRPDLERPVDLAEEIARLVGFDNFPPTMPVGPMLGKPRAWNQRLRERVRDLMAAQGFDEVINYSFAHPQAVDQLGLAAGDPRRQVVALMNPLSEDQSVLRTSLLPGLLASLRRNLSFRLNQVAIFEVGRVFIKRQGEKLPWEPARLAGILCGLAQPTSWWTGEEPVSLAHAKGAVEYLCKGLDLEDPAYSSEGDCPPYLDPRHWSCMLLGKKTLGELGLLRSRVAAAFDIDRPMFFFDLDFDLLVEKVPGVKPFTHLARFPEVTRDVAIVLDQGLAAGEVLSAARQPENKKARRWLTDVVIFDLYQGRPLPKGKKSLGLRFVYRDDKRTLTEKEVLPIHEELVDNLLRRFGGALRQ
jgi:phenylalanyl-tRNA synthetase beta chain